MSIETRYLREEDIRHHDVGGRITVEEIMSELHRVYNSDSIPDHADVVWDFADADVSGVTRDQLRRLAMYVQSSLKEAPGYRVAFITGSDLTFGMLRMYEQLQTFFTGDRIGIFRGAEDAWRWIRNETG